MGEVVDFPDKSATEHDMLEAFHRGVAAVHGLMDVLHENEGRVASAAMTGVLSAVIRRLYDECDDQYRTHQFSIDPLVYFYVHWLSRPFYAHFLYFLMSIFH